MARQVLARDNEAPPVTPLGLAHSPATKTRGARVWEEEEEDPHVWESDLTARAKSSDISAGRNAPAKEHHSQSGSFTKRSTPDF